MGWTGKLIGALIGLFIARGRIWGMVVGALIGHLIDQSMAAASAGGAAPGAGHARSSLSISDEFFRTTFELMGHVAKSDGRVSEAEIDAARRLLKEFRLGPAETRIAIECFRTGKSGSYAAELGVERLREACGMRYDLLRAFMELQLRAALAGNGLSPPARAILMQVAERLGMSGLEFAQMEVSLRARRRDYARGGLGGAHEGAPRSGSLAEFYAELEIDPGITDQEVTLAYRRQMSRHHPDKLVANGLPESMAQVAKEKTQRIQEAYEGIRAARGMK